MIEAQTRPIRIDPRQRVASLKVLNTGSGPLAPSRLHPAFAQAEWNEVRLDINPAVAPDLLGTIGDMRHLVADASFDAIWCSHNIEHLRTYEVIPSLAEFRRVLRPDGFVLLTCPDLDAVCDLIRDRGLDTTVYTSAAGPITPLDMLYGHVRSIKEGNTFMSHQTGFTEETLGKVALRAGFPEVRVAKGDGYDLWALMLMPKTDLAAIRRALVETAQAFLVD